MTDQAPLAHADIDEMQNLTLEDLARLHGEDLPESPTTLELSDQADAPIESDLALELQAHAGQQPAWADDLPSPSHDRLLRKALVMSLDGEEVHLDQKDDQRRICQAAVQLFQDSLPTAMQSLLQFLHAREQSDHLYDRLSELSNSRGAATEIIQTAKQIENVEKILQGERPDAAQIGKLEQDLAQLAEVVERYLEICRLARSLD